MRAAVRSKYGTGKVVTIKNVETPVPSDDELLIRVHAATVNRSDNHVLTGKPYAMRLFTGLFKPKDATTGSDFAGVVEAVGNKVQSFKIGDRVMGFTGGLRGGSHAEYFRFPAHKGVISMPANTTFTEAAACLEGAYYASVSIIDLKPRSGQKALVYGATGAIGSSYVQFLKNCGVYITAVCRSQHFGLVQALGAHKLIDFTKEDFTKDHERYDFVFDAVGKSTFVKCKHMLKPKGFYIPTGGFENLLLVPLTRLFGGKQVYFPAPIRVTRGLNYVRDLIEKGRFKPVIDRIYPLEKISEAYAYVASGEKIGNVVITMDN